MKTTMEEDWQAYSQAIYKGGLSKEQEAECRQAFFSGAFCALGQMQFVMNLSEKDAGKHIHEIDMEIRHAIIARGKELKRRN